MTDTKKRNKGAQEGNQNAAKPRPRDKLLTIRVTEEELKAIKAKWTTTQIRAALLSGSP